MSRPFNTLLLSVALSAIPVAAYWVHPAVGFLMAFCGFAGMAPAWAQIVMRWAYPRREDEPSEAAMLGVDLITSIVSQGGGTVEVKGVWNHVDGREFQCVLHAEAQQINQPSK